MDMGDYQEGVCRRHAPRPPHWWSQVCNQYWCGEWTHESGMDFLQFIKAKGDDDGETQESG